MTANYEVTRKECRETDEWGFRADITVRINNPDGEDIVAVRTYKAHPKHDDLVDDDELVYESNEYWNADGQIDEERSITDMNASWPPVADIDDDAALMQECGETATEFLDAELESVLE